MLTVYGIRQCDTTRKALGWLAARDIPHRFHDFRADGLQASLLEDWLASDFAGRLVNRRSTTWRQLDDAQRAASGQALIDLLLEYPTLIKRPVFVEGHILAVGFKPDALASVLRS